MSMLSKRYNHFLQLNSHHVNKIINKWNCYSLQTLQSKLTPKTSTEKQTHTCHCEYTSMCNEWHYLPGEKLNILTDHWYMLSSTGSAVKPTTCINQPDINDHTNTTTVLQQTMGIRHRAHTMHDEGYSTHYYIIH